ncbi:unnamed protein product [Protopolystoma xenopodis]|uniref:Uncharacterized protein n=1 Tax=Protopolystoma xenopodis TaxID=117903 RepID=A0A3S5AZ47_9PLAT|nr:unnamed protein product [Protopolystoma xenopodis]
MLYMIKTFWAATLPSYQALGRNRFCNELHHVRTWSVTRFRGLINTKPSSTPLASFHVTALDETEPRQLTDSVLESAFVCNLKQKQRQEQQRQQQQQQQNTSQSGLPHSHVAHLGRSNSAVAHQPSLEAK